MRRTARKLARGNTRSGNINEIARDLGQVFFNNRGQRAVKQIKRGLEKLVEEIHNEQEALQVPRCTSRLTFFSRPSEFQDKSVIKCSRAVCAACWLFSALEFHQTHAASIEFMG